jgi:hypothetical protein
LNNFVIHSDLKFFRGFWLDQSLGRMGENIFFLLQTSSDRLKLTYKTKA